MSKGNLFLGFGRGKLGDMVMYRANGEQITRARNRSPKNPQTALQLLQRVVMHTASNAYSQLAKICDHSFQGLQQGTPNQSRFIKLNVDMLRNRCADEINSGVAAVITSSKKHNYMAKGDFGWLVNPYVISEGSLPSMRAYMSGSSSYLNPLNKSLPGNTPSYAQVIDFLGAQRGDQITFISILADSNAEDGHDPHVTGLRYSRVILEPTNGNLSTRFLNGDGTITDGNAANEGSVKVYVAAVTDGESAVNLLSFKHYAGEEQPARYYEVGCAVILSRRSGDVWQRSTESLALIGQDVITNQLDGGYLGDAVLSYVSDTNSSLYLNQAEKL